MGFFNTILKPDPYTHIPGRKDLALSVDVMEYNNAEYVYVPLTNHVDLNCDAIVNEGDYVKVGQVIGERTKGISIPMHASVSGEVVGIEKKWHRSGKMVPCVKIKNDFNYTWDESCVPPTSVEELSHEEIVQMLKRNGVVGLGGSGFSTYVKYMKPEGIHTIVINGVECEPYLTTDYHLMFDQPDRLLDGIQLLIKAAKAEKGIIAIKEGKKKLKDFLEKQIANQKGCEMINVMEVPDAYPLGWEKVLIKYITGKEYDRLPSELGFAVSNVGTAVISSYAIRDNKPLIKRLVTVSGEGIKRPGLYYVRIGTPAKELIQLAGGYVSDAEEVKIIVGGPMMGGAMRNEDFVISRGVNGIIVIPTKKVSDEAKSIKKIRDILFPNFAQGTLMEKEEQPCVQCGRCTDHCPIGLQPVLIKQSAENKDKDSLTKLSTLCCVECGTCTYICPSHIEVTEFVRRGKRLLK
ncbi:MAG TPA: electron transporter RnfC [Firmicutes bacterium]|nr:electron transporter RnfC [Bacillota bacterium]